jgi:hypothetical protein
MKVWFHFFILCLLSLSFALSVMAQKVSSPETLFPQQDTLYNITPTEDGQTGYHLWVFKPGMESKMPVKKYNSHPNKDMNRNPLKGTLEHMPMEIPEHQIPHTFDRGLKPFPKSNPQD